MGDATEKDPRQTSYEAERATWQREVWAALEQRRQEARAIAERRKRDA